jgi:hypothetical protein
MPHRRKHLKFAEAYLWYFVGLITTDGCLSSDGRHINFTAKDDQFLEGLKKVLSLENTIRSKHKGEKKCFFIEFGNREFYDFLLSIGLTPKKSLTLGELKIPDSGFADFLRGVIDGDGSIRSWIHPTNGNEQWSLRVYSGAQVFIEWLQRKTEELFLAKGRIHFRKKGNGLYTLKFGKLAAQRILSRCYYEDCFALGRKNILAQICATSDTGWSKCRTLICAS